MFIFLFLCKGNSKVFLSALSLFLHSSNVAYGFMVSVRYGCICVQEASRNPLLSFILAQQTPACIHDSTDAIVKLTEFVITHLDFVFQCTSGCDQGNKSVNKTFTTVVLSPALSEESSKKSSSVNRSIEVIPPSQSEDAWKQPCFDAEQSAKTTKSLGSKIDDGARLCFPLSYAIFTVLYFGLTLYLRP